MESHLYYMQFSFLKLTLQRFHRTPVILLSFISQDTISATCIIKHPIFLVQWKECLPYIIKDSKQLCRVSCLKTYTHARQWLTGF